MKGLHQLSVQDVANTALVHARCYVCKRAVDNVTSFFSAPENAYIFIVECHGATTEFTVPKNFFNTSQRISIADAEFFRPKHLLEEQKCLNSSS